MFSLSGLLLVSLSLGLSNFAAAIGIGMGGVDGKTRWKMALVFGFFEALMPIIGLLVGQGLAQFIGDIGHYLGAGLLVLTGVYALWQAWRDTKNRKAGKKSRELDSVVLPSSWNAEWFFTEPMRLVGVSRLWLTRVCSRSTPVLERRV